MMYQIQANNIVDSQAFEHTLRFNAAHEVFAAHFPGSPIVPGAVLIDVIQSVASDVMKKPMRVAEAKNVKFITVIVPNSNVTLTVSSRYSEVTDGCLFKSVISDAEHIYVKFDLILKEA